jgi:hypothetical protein
LAISFLAVLAEPQLHPSSTLVAAIQHRAEAQSVSVANSVSGPQEGGDPVCKLRDAGAHEVQFTLHVQQDFFFFAFSVFL